MCNDIEDDASGMSSYLGNVMLPALVDGLHP